MEDKPKPDQNLTPTHEQCYNWLVVSGPYHYACNRSFFTFYRTIKATANGVPVIGNGTIELHVQTSPKASDTRALTLRNVLHMPTIPYNGFSYTQYQRGTGMRKFGSGIQGFDESRVPTVPLWYAMDLGQWYRLVLVGNLLGVSFLKDRTEEVFMNLYLSKEEEKKLQKFREP
jgi:hypothetical protein